MPAVRLRPILMAVLGVVLGAVLGALVACDRNAPSSGDEASRPPPGEAGVLNLYTARHYDADRALYDGFQRATGVRVRTLDGAPDLLIERMKAEGAQSPADVVLMADAGALWRAQQADLLQPVRSAVLDRRIPATLRDPEGRWFGFARRARVLVYDRASAPAPDADADAAAYADLADPRYRGQVCVRSSDNIYNLSTLAALIERWGPERAERWARGVVVNMARPPQGGDLDQIKAVAAGACKVALVNSYYWIRLARSAEAADRAAAARTVMVFPEQAQGAPGTLVNISGGGVARHAPNRANAVAFLEYLASDAAQAILAEANNEFPAAEGANAPEALRGYADFRADPLPVAVYGRRQAEAQAMFDRAGWR